MTFKTDFNDEDVFERFTDTARRLGFSRWQWKQMCEREEFPAPIRFGRRRLVFRRADVQYWIRQRQQRDWREHEIGVEKKRAG